MITTNIIIPAPDRLRTWNIFISKLYGAKSSGEMTRFDNETAEGFVKINKSVRDAYIRIWQVSARDSQTFSKRKWTDSSVAVTLLYIFNPEFVFLRQDAYGLQLNKPDAPLLLLIPPEASTRFELTSYHTVQLLEISLTNDFFQHWQAGQFLLTMDDPFPVIRLKMCSLPVIGHIHRLFDHCKKEETDNKEIQSLFSLLTASLVTDFSGYQNVIGIQDRPAYINKIHEVEQLITANLRKPLPALPELAKKTGMSESSLKRYFKMVYGQGIYQYYLFKKMQLARLILEEGGITVNSLAEEMGYQKVSHFITLFKKHHGYAPGALIKRQASSR